MRSSTDRSHLALQILTTTYDFLISAKTANRRTMKLLSFGRGGRMQNKNDLQ